jgi:DNA polymerase III subunit beta
MLALPAEEFPPIPLTTATASLTIPAGQLRSAIDGVAFAVSDDSTRPVLTGVLFQYDGEELTLVATDTHRLAVHKVIHNGLGNQIKVTVPEKALRTIKLMPVAPEAPMTISFDDSRLTVDIGYARVVAQLLNGPYPNWERVVPTETTRSWTMDRKEFHENVKRIMILARDNSNRVRFSGTGEKVVISAASQDKGEAKEEVAMVSSNGDIDIAFNGRYVMDALAALGGDGIQAEMTEASKPAILRPTEGGEAHFCVVMPMAMS